MSIGRMALAAPRTRLFVRELADGSQIDQIMLVRDKQVRSNRAGQVYLQLELADRTGGVGARFWNATEAETRAFEVGDYLLVRGKVQHFQGQLQLIVSYFQRQPEAVVDDADFIPSSTRPADDLFEELKAHLAKLRDRHAQAVAQAFLDDDGFVQQFCRAPAGVRNHHAYIGGLLEHVVTLLQVYDRISDIYEGQLDPDLMRLGIFLHDAGKVRELRYEKDFAYSDDGQLLGHIVLGVELLSEKLRAAAGVAGEAIRPELASALKHLILSHHGTYEYGSPRLPMTPEAVALHHLDNLDAKVHNFAMTIRQDMNSESSWTNYDPSLGRRLYKGPRPSDR